MELQESIIIFIIGLIAGVTLSKHIGNWAINKVLSKIKEEIKAKENVL